MLSFSVLGLISTLPAKNLLPFRVNVEADVELGEYISAVVNSAIAVDTGMSSYYGYDG